MSGIIKEISGVRRKILFVAAPLACVMLVVFGIVFSRAGSPEQSQALRASYEQDIRKIEGLKEAKDLSGLARLADEIESKWASLNKDYYAGLMVEVVGAFSGNDLKDDRQYVLAIKYAKAALEKGDALPLEAEIKLVRFLQGGPEYDTGGMKPEQWGQDRSERARYWLHAWQRLERSINRNFDFNQRPTLNVLPPPGYGPAGISPSSIKDPKARAEYERRIAENNEKIAEYNRQWQLRQLDDYFTPYVKRFIIEAYSKAPYNLEEIRGYLNTYGVDPSVREAILSQISQRTSQSNLTQ